MAADSLFEQYLIRRGLVKPNEDMNETLLGNDEFLAEIAGIWEGHPHALKAIIQARVHKVTAELVQEATPYEVIILRQAMVEVAALYDDFERYAQEYRRRKPHNEEGAVESGEGQPEAGTTAGQEGGAL